MEEKDIIQEIDSVIVSCNDAVRHITGGNYVAWCGTVYQIVQKLAGIKRSVLEEKETHKRETANLKMVIDDFNNGGAGNGK